MSPPKGDNDGLLSRVVRFVRNSTSGWSETDFADADRESGYSKQMLKEMIERKRRNDFVRKREFDMLRKLRRNEAIAGIDPLARPSFFQSSMPSRPDDRASTLKKIDEIEAQMSQQWWKTKGVEASRSAGFDTGGNLPSQSMALELPTQPSGDVAPGLGFLVPTVPGELAGGPGDSLASLVSSTSFTVSKAQAVDVEMLAHDPELEEAAIRFANGDDAGAEVALLALLAPGSSRAQHEDTWLALFDLYRAVGHQARYDEQAMAFADRFGRSAPQWRSLDVARPAPGLVPAAAAAPAGGDLLEAHWSSPATLGAGGVTALQATMARAAAPWRINWASLARIEPGAVVPLTLLLSQWAAQPAEIRFAGAQALEQVLAQASPSGDRQVSPAWWRLRLEALRLMHRADDFELVALDYCVTYEVSPPSWERPRCQFRVMPVTCGLDDGGPVPSALAPDASGFSASQAGATTRPGGSGIPAELAGTVQGDVSGLLERIDERLAGMDSLVISCARLARIDFAAAGTLLNWATARSAEGRMIHLTEVNRLVAEFFHVIGISTQARISVRRD